MKTLRITFSAIMLGSGLTGIGQLPDFTLVDTGTIYEYGAFQQHLSGIVIDADHDGDMDPIIGNDGAGILPPLMMYKNERNGIYVIRNFLPPTSIGSVQFTSPPGDIDNDGDIDIVGQAKFSTELGAFINDGFGNFTFVEMFNVSNSFNSFYPVLLDFNGDGFLDIIRFDNQIQVVYNDGQGRFLERDTIGHYGIRNTLQHSMSLGDADDDGDMDVYCGHSPDYDKNFFFINTGDSLKQVDEDHITLSDPTTTVCVNWIDYDNDGDMDLYVHNYTEDTINGPLPSLYENLGNLEFTKHTIYKEEYRSVYSNSSNWADLDNDGDLDLFLPLENSPFPWPDRPLSGLLSRHPFNILYLNDGHGNFTEVTDNALTHGICHTAEIYDCDNDGDLDVLTIGNAWASNGRNQLYINEGNSNSSILINCTDKYGCSTPYGTRIYARTAIFGNHVSQTRELTPVDGNLSFGNTRLHFGLGDAETIDSLIIRWPSAHVDTFLNVPANQFYNVFEDSILEIDFRATSYIQYSRDLPDVSFLKPDTSSTIDLNEYFDFVPGDTLPEISGDTLQFEIHHIENDKVVSASLDGHLLTLQPGSDETSSKIYILASAGFTRRLEYLSVSYYDMADGVDLHRAQDIRIYPNPANSWLSVESSIPGRYSVELTGLNGQLLFSAEKEGPSLQIDLSSFQKGVYFVTIRSKDFVTMRKIVKL
ncbi:MAG: FG-GAP-like repeat-containing protein, partial [Bacteroidales bacterium]